MNSDNSEKSSEQKKILVGYYYEKVYEEYLCSGGIQSAGNSYFESSVEKYWKRKQANSILELGGGSGEHLEYVPLSPTKRYVSLDLRLPAPENYARFVPDLLKQVISFEQGDAENLCYDENSFDRVVGTCLLHHVQNPLAVLLEARRVCQNGGEIAFVMPTDPGILNRLIKVMYSFRRLRKLTNLRPELIYALEHPNHINGLLELFKFAFSEDDLKFHFKPTPINSWNLNLLVVAHIVVSK